MFSGLSKNLKKILPKRLFYRALLIVAVPVITLQLLITIVFFDSLWIKTKTMEGNVVHKTNNLTEEVDIISLGTKNSITSLSTFILISTAFLNLDVLNQ